LVDSIFNQIAHIIQVQIDICNDTVTNE